MLFGVCVVVVNDIDLQQVCDVVMKYGFDVEIYGDGYEVVVVVDVQVVFVMLWGLMYEVFVFDVIVYGKLVFCEKLLVVMVDGCMWIVEVEVVYGKWFVQVGFMWLYDEGYCVFKCVIDSGQIGVLLMLYCVYCNQLVGECYMIDMVIIDMLIYEFDVLCWLFGEDYMSVQVVYLKKMCYVSVYFVDLQIVLLEIVSGVCIDVEIFVNCQYGYDIQCEVVGEQGIVKLFDLLVVGFRYVVWQLVEIMIDWKECFIVLYDVELQVFIDGVWQGVLIGLFVWDGYVVVVVVDVCVWVQQSGVVELIVMVECFVFYCG